MPKPTTHAEGDATGTWGVELGKGAKVGGTAVLQLLLVAGLLYFAFRASDLEAPLASSTALEGYVSKGEDAEAWRIQNTTNGSLGDGILRVSERLTQQGQLVATVQARMMAREDRGAELWKEHNAYAAAQMERLVERLARIEADLAFLKDHIKRNGAPASTGGR